MIVQLERPETLTTAVTRHIEEAVVVGRLPPGSLLPEGPLAARLGVSRGTVREALLMLAEQGLVEMNPHRVSVVAPVTPRTIEETYSLRVLLEPYAARLAAERGHLDGPAYTLIERALEGIRDAAEGDDSIAVIDADLAFHQVVSSLSDHLALIELLTNLGRKLRRFLIWERAYDRRDFSSRLAQHQGLVDVLRAGDPDAIEVAMRGHAREAGNALLARIARIDRPRDEEAPS